MQSNHGNQAQPKTITKAEFAYQEEKWWKPYPNEALQQNNSRNKLYEHFHIKVAYLKKKKDTYLRDVQCSVCDRKPAHDIISNKYDHQNLVIALLLVLTSTILKILSLSERIHTISLKNGKWKRECLEATLITLTPKLQLIKHFNLYQLLLFSLSDVIVTLLTSFYWCNSIIENMLKPKGMLYNAMLLSGPNITIESI